MHPEYTPADIARFWKHVDRSNPDGCWPWIGQPSQSYPEFRAWYGPDGSRIRVNAHVASYEINVGPIPDGLFVCHTCDIPRCVRPDHLFLGTPLDNQRDMITKGRQVWTGATRPARGLFNGAYTKPERRPKGERHGCAILTADRVRALRHRASTTTLLQRQLAVEFGIAQGTVSAILRRRIWADLSDE